MWPDDMAAMPTEVTRTALFGLISDKMGNRTFLQNSPIASRDDIEVLYTGSQLSAKDETVWLAILRLGRGAPMGQPIAMNKADLLRECGLARTGQNWNTLENRLRRLSNAHLEIRFKRRGKTYEAHTGLMGWIVEKETGNMFIHLQPQARELFENLTYQPWNVRLGLHSDLATRLLSYVCGHVHGKPHSVLLDDLRQWCGYQGRLRQFRAGCRTALKELETAGIIVADSSTIRRGPAGDIISWVRVQSVVSG